MPQHREGVEKFNRGGHQYRHVEGNTWMKSRKNHLFGAHRHLVVLEDPTPKQQTFVWAPPMDSGIPADNYDDLENKVNATHARLKGEDVEDKRKNEDTLHDRILGFENRLDRTIAAIHAGQDARHYSNLDNKDMRREKKETKAQKRERLAKEKEIADEKKRIENLKALGWNPEELDQSRKDMGEIKDEVPFTGDANDQKAVMLHGIQSRREQNKKLKAHKEVLQRQADSLGGLTDKEVLRLRAELDAVKRRIDERKKKKKELKTVGQKMHGEDFGLTEMKRLAWQADKDKKLKEQQDDNAKSAGLRRRLEEEMIRGLRTGPQDQKPKEQEEPSSPSPVIEESLAKAAPTLLEGPKKTLDPIDTIRASQVKNEVLSRRNPLWD